jgi:hypothetical protein
MASQKITLDEAESFLKGRVGLISGPGMTIDDDFFQSLSSDLAQKWGIQNDDSYIKIAQKALDESVSEQEVVATISTLTIAKKSSPNFERYSNMKISAVLSLSLDSHLENFILRNCEKRGLYFLPTQISVFPTILPPKTIPVFKLLGSIEQQFVYSEIGYTSKRPTWQYSI